MYLKRWILKKNNNIGCEFKGLSKIISLVLQNRGFTTQKDIDNFINESAIYKDPFKLKDMKKAVDRIKIAIENDERIIVYGDYDVDGITSTVMLFLYLHELGANVDFYIPSRAVDGYGLNIKSIDKLSDNCHLIITVDNGITAIEEIRYANNLGIDVIVTDHHKPLQELPDAVAVIDPHRIDCDSKCENLAGVGVVFKLISALEGNSESVLNKFSDIICLGTVADVMPLIDENRSIIKTGLKKLKYNPNKGLKALINVSKVDVNNISSMSISFKIAPRLNSASRMGKIDLAVDLLLTDNDNEAMKIANQLDKINDVRKKIEDNMLKEINQMIFYNPNLVSGDIIVIYKEGWNHSISGINASKLVEKYHKPCLLISIDGELANGSGRSVEGFSLIDLITWCKDDLVKYGGHNLAVGFTIKTENISNFIDNVSGYMKCYNKDIPIKHYDVDCEVDSQDITIKNVSDLRLLEPYGVGNEMPLIMIRSAKICDLISLSNGRYVKVKVSFKNGSKLDLLIFDVNYDDFLYDIGDVIDCIVTLNLNTYNNNISLSLIVKDVRLTEFDQERYFNDVRLYHQFKNIKDFELNLIKDHIPTRKEIIFIYRYLNSVYNYIYITLHDLIEYLFIKLSKYNFSYIKIGLILDILSEIKVISLKSKINILNIKKKTALTNSKTYQKLLHLANI